MQNTPRSQNPNIVRQQPRNLNVPGNTETINESFNRSVANSHQLRSVTQTVIKTREDLARLLRDQHITLLTKAKEFRKTNDFVNSSYVVYTKHRNQSESLINFLERYPQLKQAAYRINEDLKLRS